MADVTSTARLVVTVEGEGKIKALAAQIKALQGLSGSKRIGAGLSTTAAAAQTAVINRRVATVGKQQAAVSKQLATVSASQAITGKMLAPLAGQQKQTAKILTPLVAQQATLAKTQSDLTAGMLRAEKARAARLQRGREVFPEQAPAAAGITPSLLRSIKKRNLGMTEAEALRAATGGTRNLPKINKKDFASAAGQGWLTREAAAAGVAALAAKPAVAQAAAKAAGGGGKPPKMTPSQRALTSFGAGAVSKTLAATGVPAAVGAGIGTLARGLGAASAAAIPLAGTVGAMAVGFKSANAQAEDLVTNTGKAMKSRREVDEVEARQAAGESVFGKNYEQLEKRIPKLLSEQRAKRGIAGEKGLFARVGLDPARVAKLEKAGKRLDTYDIGEIFAKKREDLEAAVAGAKTPKAAEAAKKKLAQFWKDVALFGPEMVRATAFGSEALKRNRENQQKIQDAYGKGLADEKTQLQQAQENALLRGQVGSQFKEFQDRIGTFSMGGVNEALAAFNAKMLQIGPGLSEAIGRLSGIGWSAIAAGIKSIDGGWLETQLQKINQSLRDFKIEDASVESITQQLQEQFNNAMKAGVEGMTSGEGSAQLADIIAKDFKEKFWPSVLENIRRLGLLDKPKTEAEQEADRAEAERQRQRLLERESEKPFFGKEPEKPATFADRFNFPGATIDAPGANVEMPQWKRPPEALQPTVSRDFPGGVPLPTARPTGAPAVPPTGPVVMPAPDLTSAAQAAGSAFNTTVQSGISAAGSTGGQAFSTAASAGLSTAGTAAGGAFNSAVNASSIGAQIGAAAAAAISAAKVNVNVNVAGAGTAGGGTRGSPGSAGTDTPDTK
jgi:hypothetical protein